MKIRWRCDVLRTESNSINCFFLCKLSLLEVSLDDKLKDSLDVVWWTLLRIGMWSSILTEMSSGLRSMFGDDSKLGNLWKSREVESRKKSIGLLPKREFHIKKSESDYYLPVLNTKKKHTFLPANNK